MFAALKTIMQTDPNYLHFIVGIVGMLFLLYQLSTDRKKYFKINLIVGITAGLVYIFEVYRSGGLFHFFGDGVYYGALVTKIRNGMIFADPFYKGFNSNFPPLYYWFCGAFSYIFNLDTFQSLKITPLFTTILLFLYCYFLGKSVKNRYFGTVFAFLMVFIQPNSFYVEDVFCKPHYGFAVASVAFIIYLFHKLSIEHSQKLLNKRLFLTAIAGVVLYLTNFWLYVYLNMALVIMVLINTISNKQHRYEMVYRYFLFNALVALFTVYYWGPNIFAHSDMTFVKKLKYMVTNHLGGYSPSYLEPKVFYNDWILLILTGIGVLFYGKKQIIKAFFPALMFAVVFYLANLACYSIFKIGILMGYFTYFLTALYLFCSAYVLLRVMGIAVKNGGKKALFALIIFLFVYAFHNKLEAPTLVQEKPTPALYTIVEEIKKRNYPKDAVFVVSEGLNEKGLATIIPVYIFLSPVQAYSNPGLDYEKRIDILAEFTKYKGKDFYEKTTSNTEWGPIVGWILVNRTANELHLYYNFIRDGKMVGYWTRYYWNFHMTPEYYDIVYQSDKDFTPIAILAKKPEQIKGYLTDKAKTVK